LAQLPVFDPEDVLQVEPIEPSPPANERSLSRRVAVQVLYEVDSAQHPAESVLDRHIIEREPPRVVTRYLRRLILGIVENRAAIESAVVRYAPDFPLDQIAFIDRAILCIAIYEFGVSGRVPVSVAINEAVELAKHFGSEGSAAFVNGVLGAVADDAELLTQLHQPTDVDADEEDEA
jgi:transcription antitermination protein NusB